MRLRSGTLTARSARLVSSSSAAQRRRPPLPLPGAFIGDSGGRRRTWRGCARGQRRAARARLASSLARSRLAARRRDRRVRHVPRTPVARCTSAAQSRRPPHATRLGGESRSRSAGASASCIRGEDEARSHTARGRGACARAALGESARRPRAVVLSRTPRTGVTHRRRDPRAAAASADEASSGFVVRLVARCGGVARRITRR